MTNDDGIHALGLCALYEALREEHEVHVVAPEAERSAVGHAITLADPLRARPIKRNGRPFGWAVSGTPADCVKLAVHELLPGPPDLVLSGINLGANVGINVLYSGTVSAATEAAILGLRAAAFSLDTYQDPDFCFAARFAADLVHWITVLPGPGAFALNVNIPALPPNRIRGLRLTRQGTARFVERFDRRTDPRGNVYYWQAGETLAETEPEDVDSRALRDGYISITPLQFELTHHAFLSMMQIPDYTW
nr:5'/3'-nucleotidase SurE [Dissulfurirhabdus thermomarina]